MVTAQPRSVNDAMHGRGVEFQSFAAIFQLIR